MRFERVTMPSFADNALWAMRRPEGPAAPEENFLAWLLSLPDDVSAPEAAAKEVVPLDSAHPLSSHGKRLRELFEAAAECAVPNGRLS
jgi:hypothetical protein